MTHIYVYICNYIYIIIYFHGGAFHCHVRLLEAILTLTHGNFNSQKIGECLILILSLSHLGFAQGGTEKSRHRPPR